MKFCKSYPARELTQSGFICRATSRARAALMDRNYAEFELINEELHNLSTAAYFTKACKYAPIIPYPHSSLPHLPHPTLLKPVSILPQSPILHYLSSRKPVSTHSPISPTIFYTILIVSTHSSLPTLHF